MAKKTDRQITAALTKSWHRLKTKVKRSWLTMPKLWLGGSLTAVAIVIFITVLPISRTPQIHWTADRVAALQYQWPYLALAGRRDILQNQWQKAALQNGLHEGLLAITQGKNGWSIAIEALPANTIECNSTATPDNCQQLTALHKKMGMHTAELYLACLLYQGGRQQLLSKTFWDKQHNIWQGIANDLKNSSLPEFSDYAEEISDSIDHAQQCAAVQELIFSAF